VAFETIDAMPARTTAGDGAYLYNAAGNGASIRHNVFLHTATTEFSFSRPTALLPTMNSLRSNNGVTIGHVAFNQGRS
jgi:hypothetical protein